MPKLFPFWWLNPVVTCDTVKACLEGDYTTWTEIVGSPITFTYVRYMSRAAISETFGAIHDNWNFWSALINIDPPSVISEIADNMGDLAPVSTCISLLGKYLAILYTSEFPATPYLYIYKNGVLKQTITLGYTIPTGGIWISPSGKYILAMDWSAKQLHIYKGA